MRYLPQLLCFEVKPNSVYPKMDYISLLVKASTLSGYAEGTSNVSRKLLGGRKGSRSFPTGETALSYFRNLDRYELLGSTSVVLEEQVGELRKKGLLKGPVPIAFDWHDQLFYGEKGSEMVHGVRSKNGSSYAYQYLTASVLVDGRRLTVVLTPIRSRAHMLTYIDDALDRIRNMGIRVRHLLFDAGFTSVALPARLQERGYAYAIRFSSNTVTKRIGLRDGEEAQYPCGRPFRIVRADDLRTAKSYLFATNMACRPRTVLRCYKRRWGIETSYREHNIFLPKTTSRDYTVRLLYYAVAVCIYNSWCVFNAQCRKDCAVTALEVKVSVLLLALVPSRLDEPEMTDDHG
jgi:putative transposase